MAISEKKGNKGTEPKTTKTTERDHRGGKHFNLEGAKGVDLSFRPSRYTPDQLKVQSATARYKELDDHITECKLVNVSSSGVAFELPAGEVIRNGQIIESFTASFDDIQIYSGRVNVINQRAVGDVTIVGVAFYDEYLVPDTLDRASQLAASMRDLEEKYSRVESVISGSIDDRVKVIISDFNLFLAGIKEIFESLVPANASHDFEIGVIRAVEKKAGDRFHDFIHRIHLINEEISEDQSSAVADYMKQHIRQFMLPAPIYRQSYYKP
ncbi:MAG: PilZ domain-containing protein, partial [Deltaproteobacteria bacterium]|nr:PilZ domain-containing protein [Deltaproteobacteria bacterium]